MKYPKSRWNPSPGDCFTELRTRKYAVCLHHMAGRSRYLRKFEHRRHGIMISAHFTLGMDGSLEQHVDTDHVAWTQGIKKHQYKYVNWPLFKKRNPNQDVVSIEMENGSDTRFWSKDFHMPDAQTKTLSELLSWLGEEVIANDLVIGRTVIRHSDLNPRNKPEDPPVWWMENQLPDIISIANKKNKREPVKPKADPSLPMFINQGIDVPTLQTSKWDEDGASSEAGSGDLEKRLSNIEGKLSVIANTLSR